MSIADNIFVPSGWSAAWYLHGMPVEHDPENEIGWSKPEVRDATASNPNRFRTFPGSLLFTFSRIHHAGLYQIVDTTPGDTLTATAYAHAWSNDWHTEHTDDPYWSEGAGKDAVSIPEGVTLDNKLANFVFRIGIDPSGGTNPFSDTVVWSRGRHIYNKFDLLTVETKSIGKKATLFLSSRCLWAYKHNDAYWDDISMEAVHTPEPEPTCVGLPRVDYKRVYVLFPDYLTPTQRGELAPFCHRAGQWTAGSSADDAGVAALSDKTVVALDPKSIGTGINQAWYDKWYGSAPVKLREAAPDIPEIGYVVPKGYTTYQLKGRLLAQDLLERGVKMRCPSTHDNPVVSIGGEFGNDRGTYIHNGLDIRASWAAWGDMTIAAIGGEVIRAGYYNDEPFYGWQVRTQTKVDDYLVLCRYAHMVPDSVLVEPGDIVSPGEELGKPDNTGNSTGDHLHFDVAVHWSGGNFYADPAMLIDWSGYTPDQPDEPTGGNNTQTISLHVQTEEKGYLDFVGEVKPSWVKLVGNFEAAQRIKSVSPHTKVLIRQKIDNQGQYLDPLDVNGFLATFKDSLERNAQWIDAFEGLNEEAPSTHLVEWMINLSHEVWQRYGNDIALCAGNLAVGNGEGSILFPAAEVIAAHNHYFGYHTYWPANLIEAERWMEECDWAYHMRDLSYLDPYFCAHGSYVRWLGTESGAVGSKSGADGWPTWLNPGAGWRSGECLAGDQARMIRLVERFLAKTYDWNVQHNDRKECDMLFTVGAVFIGWKDFKYWEADMDALGDALI